MAVLAGLLATAACGDTRIGIVDQVTEGLGGAVSDEPAATIVARDILSAGGNAADAVVAAYFTLAATYPVAAGLGGGGICVVHDSVSGKAEALDFTVGRAGKSSTSGFVVAVPGNVRGMAALHARYGRLRWGQVVQPGERLARLGHPVSRALAVALDQSAGRLGRDQRARALFTGPDGKTLREGRNLEQIDLAVILGQIRTSGAGAFYNGAFARRFARGVTGIGGVMSAADLRGYRPVWQPTESFSLGRHDVHFPPAKVSGGNVAARLWDALKEKGQYSRAPRPEREMAIVQALADAYATKGTTASAGTPGRMRKPAVTSFAAIDRAGGAAACAVTMNGAFGTGRIIPGTGLFAARAELPGGGQPSLATMIITNRYVSNAYFVAGASGDSAGPGSLISVALKVLVDGQGLSQAIGAARFHSGAKPKSVIVESNAGKGVIQQFKGRGFRVHSQPALARVNAIYCSGGIRRNPLSCRYAVDSRGHGYAAGTGR